MDALAVLAGSWGVLMGISPLLQIRRIVQRGSSADVSIGYLTVLIVGFALWAAYGASIANVALIISNSVALVVGLATIAIARRYRHPAGPGPVGLQGPAGTATTEGRAAD